jgi:lipopolysaccharide export system permease protein
MRNVFIAARTHDEDMTNLIYAESGIQRIEPDGERYLLLQNGTRYLGRPGELDYQSIAFSQYGMKIEETDVEAGSVDREAMSTKDLLSEQDLESVSLLQWRMSLPLLVPVMTLLAVSISRVNPRQGRFAHLFPAMLIYVAYLGLLIVARKNLAKGELPDWLGLWGVHLIFLLISLILLQKEKLVMLIKQIVQRKVSNAQT